MYPDLHDDPAVSRLDVASCVPDVAPHLIVGEVRLLDQLRGVYCHLDNKHKEPLRFRMMIGLHAASHFTNQISSPTLSM